MSSLATLFAPGQFIPDLDDDDFNALREVIAENERDRRAQAALALGSNYPPASDLDALNRINNILSAPSWGVGMLEDICAIVRATGRTEVPGAVWERH